MQDLVDTRWLDGLLRQFVRDEDLVEDLRQETIARALRHPESATRPWLARVARNLALSCLRRESTRRRLAHRLADSGFADPTDDLVAEAELRRGAVAALLELDEPYRGALLRRYMLGQSPREIASTLAVPLETVRTRLKRGLVLLRTQLDARPGQRLGLALLALPRGAAPSTLALWGLLSMKTKTVLSAAVLVLAGVTLSTAWLLDPSNETGDSDMENPPSMVVASSAKTETPNAVAAAQREVLIPEAVEPAPETSGHGSLLIRLRWNRDGELANGIGVRLRDPNRKALIDRIPRQAVSGADGMVRFTKLMPGSFSVKLDRSVHREIDVVAGAEAVLDIIIPDGRDVHGVVVDINNAPVAGAEVLSVLGGIRPQWVQAMARTDSAGRFSLRSMHAHNLIGARADGHATSNFRMVMMSGRRDDGGAEMRLRLGGPESILRGRVVGPDGDPVASAWVKVGHNGRSVDGAKLTLPPFEHLRTDRDGEFTARHLRAGEVPVRVYAAGLPPWRGAIECAPARTTEHAISMTAGAVMIGRVLDPAGRPVSDVDLGVKEVDDYPASSNTRTDADGRYRLENLPAGPITVELAASGRGTVTARVEVQLGIVNVHDLRLKPDHVIQGVLLDERDRPIPGWMVKVASGTRSYRTDKKGRFRIVNCEDREYRVLVMQSWGFHPAILIVPDVRPRQADYEFRVPDARLPSATIAGRILDADGRPLEGVHLSVRQVAGAGLVPVTDTGVDGRFCTKKLPPGEYRLGMSHPNHKKPDSVLFVIRSGEAKQVGDLRLQR